MTRDSRRGAIPEIASATTGGNSALEKSKHKV